MKRYRLKQWYPRIPVYLEDGYIISFDENKGIAIYEFVNGTLDTFEMSGAELECTQYWELIEEQKPLFITEDGVEMFDENAVIFAVGKDMDKLKVKAKSHDVMNCVLTDLLEEYLDVNTSVIDNRVASIAIEALENIANPLKYLLEEAKKERRSLNAYIAGKLMENPYFYADIAEKALGLIKQTKAMQEELILKERGKE